MSSKHPHGAAPGGASAPPGGLQRHIGVPDAVMIGLGSMIGAGIFASLAPAARAAGSGLLLGLALAAVVAYCNATSSARLAALYPASGGTYVYGRERLGPFWGYLAGWAFVVGKTASCAAMALTVGSYVWPGQAHAIAVAAVVALTAVNYAGIQKSVLLTRVIVAVVLAVLAAVATASLTSGGADAARLEIGADATAAGVLQAAGLLFFAFAGYARIATLGEEARDPARTIPRAPSRSPSASPSSSTPSSPSPSSSSSAPAHSPPPRPRSRTPRGRRTPTGSSPSYASARPSPPSAPCSPSSSASPAPPRPWPATTTSPTPWPPYTRASRSPTGPNCSSAPSSPWPPRPRTYAGRSGFSSFGVLAYYAIANASAWTLTPAEGRPARIIPVVGLAGCLVLAFTLPLPSVISGATVLLIGAAAYGARRT